MSREEEQHVKAEAAVGCERPRCTAVSAWLPSFIVDCWALLSDE
jgi:hypothetical protein